MRSIMLLDAQGQPGWSSGGPARAEDPAAPFVPEFLGPKYEAVACPLAHNTLAVAVPLALDGKLLASLCRARRAPCHRECLPVSCVKIDASLSKALLLGGRHDVVIQTIAQLSRSRGIECVAECVESAEAAKRLKELGADSIAAQSVHRPRGTHRCERADARRVR